MDNCGFQTTIVGTLKDGRNFTLEIESGCESIRKLAEKLREIDFHQLFQNMQDSIIYQAASACLKHSACLVPAAIVRIMEIESGMALSGNSSIVTEKL